MRKEHSIALRVFQFTPLREGRRTPWRTAWSARRHFNSRPYVRGDSWTAGKSIFKEKFQFTPLREGRPRTWTACSSSANFNSRPYVRGDLEHFNITVKFICISIHAPT